MEERMESVLGLLDRHMCCPELSHRQISRTVGQRTVGEVQWVYREPASDVLPDALPHREKVLELQGLRQGYLLALQPMPSADPPGPP